MDLLGKTVGQYQLIELISESDKNLVYKGFQPALNRYAAVKILSPSQAWDQTIVQQFQQEVQLLVGLQYKNILQVYDYGQEQGVYYMATEYVEGATLKDRLAQYHSLPRARNLINSVTEALDYAHGQGVVHGNIKPSNILIDREHQSHLTDFGAFQQMGELGQGSPYRSPEQARSGPVDRRTDVYALGVLLYEIVTGEAPEAGIVPNPRLKRPDLPVEVEQIILKAMAQYPEQRFQTAGEVSKALDAALGIQDSTQATPVVAAAPMPTVAPEPEIASDAADADNKRMMWIIGGLAVALLALVACLIFFFFSGGDSGGDDIIVVVPTPAPAVPSVTALVDTEIRSGPGTVYDRIGVLEKDQNAEAIGRSPDGSWWTIKVAAVSGGQGWVAANTVEAGNTDNLPVIEPPPTPTPKVSEPEAPTAVIEGTTQAQVGQTAGFSAAQSQAAEGSHLATFEWDFDDGTTASGVDVTHIYNDSGTFQVELTVTDDKGLADTTTHKVKIDKAPDTPEPDEPPTAVVNGPTRAEIGEEVTFDANQSGCAGSCVSYAWDMGDGNQYNAVRVNHVYNAAGVYIVSLTVTDDKGLSGSTTHQVEVEGGEQPGADLEGKNWQLDDTIAGTEITALFENGSVTGFGGCNDYSGTYTVDSDKNLTISLGPVTGVDCEDNVTAQENEYLRNLSSATNYDTRNNNLRVFGAQTLTYTEQ